MVRSPIGEGHEAAPVSDDMEAHLQTAPDLSKAPKGDIKLFKGRIETQAMKLVSLW